MNLSEDNPYKLKFKVYEDCDLCEGKGWYWATRRVEPNPRRFPCHDCMFRYIDELRMAIDEMKMSMDEMLGIHALANHIQRFHK